jgi:hypothetical protein
MIDRVEAQSIPSKTEETRLSITNPFQCDVETPSGYVLTTQLWYTASQLFTTTVDVDRSVVYTGFGDLVEGISGTITVPWWNSVGSAFLTGMFTPQDWPKQLVLGFLDDNGVWCRDTSYFVFLDRTGPSAPNPIVANYYFKTSQQVEELHFWWESSVDTGAWFSGYTFVLSPNSNLSNPLIVQPMSSESYVFDVADFPEYGYWYWQVWGHDILWNITPWTMWVILYINDYGWGGWWGGGGHSAPDDKPDDWVDPERTPEHDSAPDKPSKPIVKPPKPNTSSPLPPVVWPTPAPVVNIYPTCADLIKRWLTCTPGLPPPPWWFPKKPIAQVNIPPAPTGPLRPVDKDRLVGDDRLDYIAMVGDIDWVWAESEWVWAESDPVQPDIFDKETLDPVYSPDIIRDIGDVPPNVIIPRLLERQAAPAWTGPIILTTNAFLFVRIWYDLETLRRWYRLWNNHHQSVYTHIVWHNGMWFIIHDTAATLYSTLSRHDA